MVNNFSIYKSQWNLFTLFLCCFLITNYSFAQFPNYHLDVTLVRVPCNGNGILVAYDSSNSILPATFTWHVDGQNIVHTSNQNYDTLFNYDGSAVSVTQTPGVNVGGAPVPVSGHFSGIYPFSFRDSSTLAICPALGSASLNISGGVAPYIVQWMDASNGNIVANGNPVNLPVGDYYVLITDAAGCVTNYIDTSPVSVLGPQIVFGNISSTDANCTNGTVSVTSVSGGIPPYNYMWSNGANTPSITGLQKGYYYATVSDAQGCKTFFNEYVNQTVSIAIQNAVTNATCLQNDGSITAFGSGGNPPYTYRWDNGQQNQTANSLAAGYYSVTVTDANNCISNQYASVSSTTPISVTNTTIPSSCTSATGTATLSIAGGTPPYSVSWQTYPPQTGLTATNLAPGVYGFIVNDASGCIRNGQVYVPPVGVISAYTLHTDAICPLSNGTATMLVYSSTNPYTYHWSNGATTPVISGLSAGMYSCTVTDSVNCSLSKTVYINVSAPMSIGLTNNDASCIFRNDGRTIATVLGGTPPYTYNWSNGQTTDTATALSTGHYYLIVQDSNGCSKNEHTYIGYDPNNDSCYCTLSGKVYIDTNTNCTFDNGELPVHNIMVHCPSIGYTFTDIAGSYSFIVPSGNYTLSEAVQAYYPLAPCQNNFISITANAASGCVINNDFANIINPIHDIKILTTDVTKPIPGYNYTQRLVVQNDGTTTEDSIQLNYEHDGQLLLSSITPNIFYQPNNVALPNYYSVTNTFGPLAASNFSTFNITYNVPANVPLNTSVVFTDTTAYHNPLLSWLNDYSPWNNVDRFETIVIGSFDPNFKSASPQGVTNHGYITNRDSIITYSIHFQNTGTYLAQKVIVIDTLDSNLDISTLKPGYSNYPCKASLSDSGVLKFVFDNIQLPPQYSDSVNSIGIVMYSIHTKPNLTVGTEIKSPANIYFDYNAPVATNAALNTIDIGDTTSIKAIENGLGFSIYPNPAHSNITLMIDCNIASNNSTIKIYNTLGIEVQSQQATLMDGKNIFTSDVSHLSSGLYFVQVYDGERTLMQKLSIAK